MESTVIDALMVAGACLLIGIVAVAIVIFRPDRRRHRRRKRHSRRPKIDLFTDRAADSAPSSDA